MPTYEVTWNLTKVATSTITANSEEEALKRAEELPVENWDEWEGDYFDWIPASAELQDEE